jgi:PAS domain-containing protein
MSIEASYSQGSVGGESRGLSQSAPSVDALRPLLAGARARGMADALELAGIAAVLIDKQGMVLHAGSAARRLFGADLSLNHDHLVAGDSDSTRAIQSLISEALGEGPDPSEVAVPRRDGTALVLSARRVPGASEDFCQMLKALIIIEEQRSDASGN